MKKIDWSKIPYFSPTLGSILGAIEGLSIFLMVFLMIYFTPIPALIIVFLPFILLLLLNSIIILVLGKKEREEREVRRIFFSKLKRALFYTILWIAFYQAIFLSLIFDLPIWVLGIIIIIFISTLFSLTHIEHHKEFFAKEAEEEAFPRLKLWKSKMESVMRIFSVFLIILISITIGLMFFTSLPFSLIITLFFIILLLGIIPTCYVSARAIKYQPDLKEVKKARKNLWKKHKKKLLPYYLLNCVVLVSLWVFLIYLIFLIPLSLANLPFIIFLASLCLILAGLGTLILSLLFSRNISYFHESSEIAFGTPRKEYYEKLIYLFRMNSSILIIMGVCICASGLILRAVQ